VGAARPDEEVSQAPCVADDLVVEEKMYFEHDKPCRGNDLETTARRTTLVHVGGADFNYTASRAVVSCLYMKQGELFVLTFMFQCTCTMFQFFSDRLENLLFNKIMN